jgi:starch synthase
MIAVVHPTGNRFVEALVEGLAQREMLNRYYTTVAVARDARWPDWLPRRLARQVQRRRAPLPGRLLARRPWRESVRLLLGNSIRALVAHESGWASVDAVYHDLDRWAARSIRTQSGVRGVYAYEDGALASFRAAADRDLACIYDLPIGYWRAGRELMAEERQRMPEWAATLTGLQDSPAKLARKDEELMGASSIVVASSFTRDSLRLARLAAGAAVHIVPYGAPPAWDQRALEEKLRTRKQGKLKLLYVGSLSQRKGLAEVFAAAAAVKGAAELTVIGRAVADCRPLREGLKAHRYLPSLPHAEILREMREHDLLLFPSLFEGFGLVILEAMAQGMPVITTTHTAGPDVIRSGVDGMLVPIRDAAAIATAILTLGSDRVRLAEMSLAARERAIDFTWSRYRAETIGAIESTVAACGAPRHAG